MTDWGLCISGGIRSTVQAAGRAQGQKHEARQPAPGREDSGHARGEQTRRLVDQHRQKTHDCRGRGWWLLGVCQPPPRLQSPDRW